ncbi:MAG: YcaO-like family protein [Synechococcus sp.]
MLTSYNCERDVVTREALEIAQELILAYGAKVRFESFGKTIKTYYCCIEDAKGFVSSGWGKGLGIQSKTSSLCEALEHYFYYQDAPKLKNVCYSLSNDLTLAQGALRLERFKNNSFAPEFWSTEYKLLGTLNSSSWLPIFLTDVEYQPRGVVENFWLTKLGLQRYSTNSGAAAGITLDEALLHGILEQIERDALGIELMRTVVCRSQQPVRIVDKTSMPRFLIQLSDIAESENDAVLTIYDITSDLEVPVFLVELKLNGNKKRFFGSGASLSCSYAVERAILESIQSYHSDRLTSILGLKPLTIQLGSVILPRYLNAYLELGNFNYKGGKQCVQFPREVCKPNEKTSVQLARVIERLASKNIRIGSRIVYSSEKFSFFVAQTLAPALDRFHLISHGVPVSPGFRASQYID